MSKHLYIVDVIAEVVAATQSAILATIQQQEAAALGATGINCINYQKGHLIELIDTLAAMSKDNVAGALKYPLIYLVQDFDEIRGRQPGIYAETRLNIVIAHFTQKTHTVDDRYTQVFKPVLYPIYNEFINQLAKHPLIVQGDAEDIDHVKTDRLYWGKKAIGGNEANKLNDHVDAIEIQNLELKFYYKTC